MTMKNFYRAIAILLPVTFLSLTIFLVIGILAGRFPITYKPEPDKEVYIVRTCGTQNSVEVTEADYEEYTGIASWYDYQLPDDDGWYSTSHATAASRSLERYSYAKVTNISNGKSVVVRINDYGPAEWTEREIDLSSYAFSQIADLKLGLINVKIEPLHNLSTTNDN